MWGIYSTSFLPNRSWVGCLLHQRPMADGFLYMVTCSGNLTLLFSLSIWEWSLLLLLPEQHSAASFGFAHTVRKILVHLKLSILRAPLFFAWRLVDLVIEEDTQ